MKKPPPLDQYDRRYLRLLKMGEFVRRRGAWRFGTNKMSNAAMDATAEASPAVAEKKAEE
jgi:hypothetical protein